MLGESNGSTTFVLQRVSRSMFWMPRLPREQARSHSTIYLLMGMNVMYPQYCRDLIIKECKRYHKRKVEYKG
jgi:hypothetical protein